MPLTKFMTFPQSPYTTFQGTETTADKYLILNSLMTKTMTMNDLSLHLQKSRVFTSQLLKACMFPAIGI